MIRKIFMAVIALILCVPVISFASDKYAAELKQERKRLIMLTEQIQVEKKKLKKLSAKYKDEDMAMRQQLLKDKGVMSENEYIRKCKLDQESLRKEYFKNKKPLKAEYNKLKNEYHASKKSIKILTKKMDRLAKDPDNETYNAEVAELKGQIAELVQERNNAIGVIRENADKKIGAITDMSEKSSIKKQILTKARDEELALRKEYAAKKDAIVVKINDARDGYKKKLKVWRMKQDAKRKEDQLDKVAQQRKKIAAQPVSADSDSETIAVTNFGPK